MYFRKINPSRSAYNDQMHAYKLYSIFYYTYQYFQAKLIIDIIISSKMLTFVVENNTFCALILDFRDSFCNHSSSKSNVHRDVWIFLLHAREYTLITIWFTGLKLGILMWGDEADFIPRGARLYNRMVFFTVSKTSFYWRNVSCGCWHDRYYKHSVSESHWRDFRSTLI